MKTKLYILKIRDDISHEVIGARYDIFDSFVIEAASPEHARRIAHEAAADEKYTTDGRQTWLDESVTSCKELKPSGEEGVVISSFNAG